MGSSFCVVCIVGVVFVVFVVRESLLFGAACLITQTRSNPVLVFVDYDSFNALYRVPLQKAALQGVT